MSELNRLILIGVDKPGPQAIKALIDVSGVKPDGLRFFPYGTEVTTVIKKSFIRDKTQKVGFDTRNSSLIITDGSDPMYKIKVKNIKNFGVEIRHDFDEVNLDEMNESEIHRWYKQGRFIPQERMIDDDISDDDILSILDSDDDFFDPHEEVGEEELPIAEGPKTKSMFDDLETDHASITSEIPNKPVINHPTMYGSPEPEEDNRIVDDTIIEDDEESPSLDDIENMMSSYSEEGSEEVNERDITGEDGLDDDLFELLEEEEEQDDTPEQDTPREPEITLEPEPEVEPVIELEPEVEIPPAAPRTPPVSEPRGRTRRRRSSNPLVDFNLTGAPKGDSSKPSPTSITKPKPQEPQIDPEELARQEEERLAELEEKRVPKLADDGSFDNRVLYDQDGDRIDDLIEETGLDISTPGDDGEGHEEGYGQDDREAENERRRKISEAKNRRALIEARESNIEERKQRALEKVEYGAEERLDRVASDLVGETSIDKNSKVPPYVQSLTRKEQEEQLRHEQETKTFGNINPSYLRKGQGRVIMVTSAKGGVGKSTVSYGMAAALALARARDNSKSGGSGKAQTWLIESDYQSPKLNLRFRTGDKHLGNVADSLEYASRENMVLSPEEVHEFINQNVHVDEYTGLNILACPNALSLDGTKGQFISNAIVSAIRYASQRGDAVIVDHGNLTSSQHSVLDGTLAFKVAHHVTVVADVGCLEETQNLLSFLTSRRSNANTHPLSTAAIHVVMNNTRSSQFDFCQNMLRPHVINAILPPISDLRPENSIDGKTYIAEKDLAVKKAVIDRCGQILIKCGYTEYKKYFGAKLSPSKSKKNTSFFKRMIANFTGN